MLEEVYVLILTVCFDGVMRYRIIIGFAHTKNNIYYFDIIRFKSFTAGIEMM